MFGGTMEIKGLFDSLAGYLDFIIDCILLSGMEKYARLGNISPTLVTFFVIGVFVAYLIASMNKMPGYEKILRSDQVAPSDVQTDVKKFQVDMAQFVMGSIAGAIFLHGFLKVYNQVFGTPTIGSVKDTLNGIFAYNAIYHPMNAVLQQIGRGANALVGLGANLVGGVLLVGVVVVYLVSGIFLLYPLAAVHQTSIGSLILPCLVFVAFFFLLFALFFLALGTPLKEIFRALFTRGSEHSS
jgi:hypothetical protein